MRADMFEVLIERPRGGLRIKHRRGNKPRTDDWDGEDGFEDRVAPRPHRTKFFDDHLQPLRRWLRKQVNRPWDKVYSELCATIDGRSVTGQHLLSHLRDEVERECELGEDGEVYSSPGHWRRGGEPVQGLYVHPRTGLLRWRETFLGRAIKRERDAERTAKARMLIPLQGGRFLWCQRGVWYQVQARHCDGAREVVHFVENEPGWFGVRREWQVTSKRQLSSRELRERGLENATME